MKTIDYYMSLPWTYSIETEESNGSRYYIIRVNEFPGVCTDNEDLLEGMKDIKEVLQFNIELCLRDGEEVPCPIDKSKYKGKILYRTDAKTHYDIARAAKREHKSISKILDMIVKDGMKKLRL